MQKKEELNKKQNISKKEIDARENLETYYKIVIKEKRFFRKSFLIAAVGFLIICGIGFSLKYFVDGGGILNTELTETSKFDFDMYKQIMKSQPLTNIGLVSIGAIGLIFISSICNIIGSFRVSKASKPFMYFFIYIYVIAQGLGFGMLFMTGKAIELMIIFGIFGIIFLLMSLFGYLSKQFLPLIKGLIGGGGFAGITMFIGLILFFTKVYEDKINIIAFSGAEFLALAGISFTTGSIRRVDNYKDKGIMSKGQEKNKLEMGGGFRLLSDFIVLISVFGFLIKKMRNIKF